MTPIDAYIARFPEPVQEKMYELVGIIKEAAPEAEEVMSYQMPAFRQHKVLCYFAGWPRHIGFYPTSSGIEAFRHELTAYTWSKGAIQFPLDEPLPKDLIQRIVRFRLQDDAAGFASRRKKKASA